MKNNIIFLLSFCFYGCFGQTPATDSNYTLVFEDNFNTYTHWTQLDTNWSFLGGGINNPDNLNDPDTINDGRCYCSTNDGHNHSVDTANGGICTITFRKEPPNAPYNCFMISGNPDTQHYVPMNYTSGFLVSKDSFQYGYYEIRSRLPDFSIANNYEGLIPNFWMMGFGPYSEIDVYETVGGDYNNSNIVGYWDHGTNWHRDGYSWGNQGVPPGKGTFFDYHETFDNQFHTYGLEWTPSYISWYKDGVKTETYYESWGSLFSPTYYPLRDMRIIISIRPIKERTCWYLYDATGLPLKYEIDYVKVWKYKTDCLNDGWFQNNDTLSSHDHKVKKTIRVGQNGSNWNIPFGTQQSISFRATDSILLEDGFEVPLGKELYINVHDCPSP